MTLVMMKSKSNHYNSQQTATRMTRLNSSLRLLRQQRHQATRCVSHSPRNMTMADIRSSSSANVGIISNVSVTNVANMKVHMERLQSYQSINAFRHFSTTTGTAVDKPPAAAVDAASKSSADPEKAKKKKEDDSNFNWFFDNIGKIFLTIIGAIIASLVRSSYNTSNRNKLRDEIEAQSALDPCEIQDLRIANSELTPDVFRTIMDDLYATFPANQCSYEDFVAVTRNTMKGLKGEAFTIQLGHQFDRVVASILAGSQDSEFGSDPKSFPLMLWMAILTLALHSPVLDRVKVLFEVLERDSQQQEHRQELQHHQQQDEAQEETPCTPTVSQVIALVGFLQDTHQLPPDTQIVPTEEKYPTQQWKKATSEELVPWEGTQHDAVDLDAFSAILRSKSVCAWGECYHKKKFGTNEPVST